MGTLPGAPWVPSNADNEILLGIEIDGEAIARVGEADGTTSLVAKQSRGQYCLTMMNS